jgi:protein TonB
MASAPQPLLPHITLRGLRPAAVQDRFRAWLGGAIALHLSVAAAFIFWTWIHGRAQNWGDASATNGAIQATMVNALPLPPRQPTNTDNVLATETPSPAPVAPKPRTVEVPKPDAIPIPVKPTKPAPQAEKAAPPPPPHPQPTKVEPTKAQTGEASGVRIAMSADQTRIGTFSVGVSDSNFGTRFAYYNQQIKRKLEAQWQINMLDNNATGHRVYITFQIARDGSPSHIQIQNPSGDGTLDQTAMRAVQVIDTFGPLPDAYQGSFVNVLYYFEPPPRQ